jgi:hypothetical protein
VSVHEYERQSAAPDECGRCSMPPDFHPPVYTEVPELQTSGPLLPEDSIDYGRTWCPVCKVTTGSCISRDGYYRPAHQARLDRAVKAAS